MKNVIYEIPRCMDCSEWRIISIWLLTERICHIGLHILLREHEPMTTR